MKNQGEHPPCLVCHRRKLDPALGYAHTEFWEKIPATPLLDTVTGRMPRQPSWFKTAWDESELRVIFHCEDERAWATLRERDAALYEEEVVEVFLDPVGDLESYFEIEVNPLNAVCDLVLRRTRSGYRKDFAWDCNGLRTAVTKDAQSWSAELSIPFASLDPALPTRSGVWRANFYRIDRPTDEPPELSAWSPTGQPLFHVQQRFGWLEFAGYNAGASGGAV